MYVRGYLQGSENGRVVTIDLVVTVILFKTREINVAKKQREYRNSETLGYYGIQDNQE